MSWGRAEFSRTPYEYAGLDAPGAVLKIRVSLVQFRPWAQTRSSISSRQPAGSAVTVGETVDEQLQT
jgi:hypothetical protein